uniref:Nuclear receptor 2C2-associated protein n=1 Tax=Fundulus heteroclitus TaxID=8078 RepID=A0A3Q2Q284_FUNHE
MATSLICSETQSRVSSVLNRDVKQYGKKFMFDCNEETCWSSDQGDCQWVSLEFPQTVKVSEVKLQFQGGFSAKTCRLEGRLKDGDFLGLSQFYPEDNNCLQISSLLTEHFTRGLQSSCSVFARQGFSSKFKIPWESKYIYIYSSIQKVKNVCYNDLLHTERYYKHLVIILNMA